LRLISREMVAGERLSATAIFVNDDSDCLNIAIFVLSHAVNW
jgi:hypothetical protein